MARGGGGTADEALAALHDAIGGQTIDVGGRLSVLLFGRRNVALDLRIDGVVVSSVEYVVGPAGVASARALRRSRPPVPRSIVPW